MLVSVGDEEGGRLGGKAITTEGEQRRARMKTRNYCFLEALDPP
jgi:hypothetical protein